MAEDKQSLVHPGHHLEVIYVTRSPAIAKWYTSELKAIMSAYGATADEVKASVYVTSNANAVDPSMHDHSDELDLELNKEIDINIGASNTTSFNSESNNKRNNDNDNTNADIDDDHDPNTSITTSTVLTSAAKNSIKIYHNCNRPNLPSIIAHATTTSSSSLGEVDDDVGDGKWNRGGKNNLKRTSMSIYSCGPSSMLHDVRNAAASAQVRILRNDSGTVAEVDLHSEAFGYAFFFFFSFALSTWLPIFFFESLNFG